MQIDIILRERGYTEFGPLATYVQDDTIKNSPIQHNGSIYHELSAAEDANIYFNLGISLPFVKWLLDHDAPICEWIQHWSPP
ncbi:hypothetical protein V8C34DRAFT_317783 [Trichoderma compactum]